MNQDPDLIFLIRLISCFQDDQFNKVKIVVQTST
jgi:hypothetical protein